jgi:hypothetical protein
MTVGLGNDLSLSISGGAPKAKKKLSTYRTNHGWTKKLSIHRSNHGWTLLFGKPNPFFLALSPWNSPQVPALSSPLDPVTVTAQTKKHELTE